MQYKGLALRGLHTGGRIFGYNTASFGDGTGKKLAINQPEATVVRRIFELSANGLSLKKIAGKLNAERVPSPGARKDRLGGEWCPTAIREMLRNELYIGNIVWNRSKFVKIPGTNKRQRRNRPESEWVRHSRPDLAIIGHDLWSAVRNRFASLPAIWGYQKKPGLLPRGTTSRHLFSGMLKCGNCGANLIIATGGGTHRHPKYACSRRFNRGGCQNDLYIRRDDLEDMLLGKLQNELMRPEVRDYAVAQFQNQLEAARSRQLDDMSERRQRRGSLETEVRRLASAIAESGHSKVLLELLNSKEAELQIITDSLESINTRSVESSVDEIQSFVANGLIQLRDLLRKDTTLARNEILKHTSVITMTPHSNEGRRFYVAEGNWDLLGREPILDQRRQRDDWRLRMVAGVRFELTTFGL